MHEDTVLKRLKLQQLNEDLLLFQYQNKVPSELNTHNSSPGQKYLNLLKVVFQKNYAH